MSWLFSQVLVEEYSEGISLDGELFAPSNGSHTQPVFSSHDKMTVFSRRSLSGMTFKLLTEADGEAVLMSFLADSPAKTSQSQARELESTESEAVCGDTWHESSARYCPDSSSWKTHRCLWEEDLPESSVILPRWGMMLNGVLWERITSPLHTSGIESGSWATPTTMDSLPPKSSKALMKEATEARPGRSKPANLRDQVSNSHLWPTPTVNGNHNRKGLFKNSGDGLATAVMKFPTPTTQDAKNNGAKSQMERNTLPLNAFVKKFPTPCASDADKWNRKTLEEREADNQQVRLGNALSTNGVRVGGNLNPMWIEWLMGWPLGWTDLKPLETGKFQQWQHSHGKS